MACCCNTLKNATAYSSSLKLLNKSAMLHSRKFCWYLLLRSSMTLFDVIVTSYSWQRYVECLVTTMFQQDSALAHRAAHVQELNCFVKKRQNSRVQPVTCKQPKSQSCGLRDLGCRTTDTSVVWMNWNGGSSMSGAVLNSRFFMRLLTSGKEDIEGVSMLNEDISSTAWELKMLILSIYVKFNVTCLTVPSFITKSCQQHWPIHSCSFYNVVQ